MFTRVLAATAALSVAMAAPALAQVGEGDAAPDVQIKEWVKGNACKSLKDMRGKAVLLEFFATT